MNSQLSVVLQKKQDVLPASSSCIVPDSSLPADERDVYRAYTNGTLGTTAAALFVCKQRLVVCCLCVSRDLLSVVFLLPPSSVQLHHFVLVSCSSSSQ